MSICYGKAEMR